MSKAPSFLEPGDGRRIAHHRLPSADGGGPGVVFLGGFRSDMTGTKAEHLETWARANGRAFLRFDYTGHGASSGEFMDGCIGDWARDARDAVGSLTEGPQILVGSSMGGWIALLLARAMPERVAGMVGIAAAPDFTADAIDDKLDEPHRRLLAEQGYFEWPSRYDEPPTPITARLVEDGRDQLVLRHPLHLPFPVRLLHGTADLDVDVSVALRLLDHASGPDIRLTLVKDAGHRFSEPADLAHIVTAVEEVTAAAR